MVPVHLFYSWQSDRDSKVCKEFIWRALEEAAGRIEAEHGIALRLDRDTLGLAGTPAVTKAILDKISACDIFVADMTFVGRAESASQKYLPNPNIMTEYGYARAVKASDRILLVMNTAFGPPRELPFDMREFRFPAEYSIESTVSDSARRQRRSAFAETLVPHLLEVIAVVQMEREKDAPFDDREERVLAALTNLDLSTNRGELPTRVVGPRLRLCLAPFALLDPPLFDLKLMKSLRPRFVPEGFASELRDDFIDSHQWASFDPPQAVGGLPNPQSQWIVRVVEPGMLEMTIQLGTFIAEGVPIPVDGYKLEARLVRGAQQLAMLADLTGLGGRFAFVALLHGVSDVRIGRSRAAGHPVRHRDFSLGTVCLSSSQDLTAEALHPFLNRMWRLSHWEDGSPSFGGGRWAGYGQSELYQL